MSALLADVLDGSVTPVVARAAIASGSQLLRVVEMKYKYGSPKEQKPLALQLSAGRE